MTFVQITYATSKAEFSGSGDNVQDALRALKRWGSNAAAADFARFGRLYEELLSELAVIAPLPGETVSPAAPDKAPRQWAYEARDAGRHGAQRDWPRWGRVGNFNMAQTGHGDGPGCLAVEYLMHQPSAAAGWRQCGQPIFGLLDLETDGLEPFGLCFGHLCSAAAVDPAVPIRPL